MAPALNGAYEEATVRPGSCCMVDAMLLDGEGEEDRSRRGPSDVCTLDWWEQSVLLPQTEGAMSASRL